MTVVDTTLDLDSYKSGVYAVAIGKAAAAMAAGVNEVMSDKISQGIITSPAAAIQSAAAHTPGAAFFAPDRWRLFAGGHPLPDEESLKAAGAVFELLQRAGEERALVIFLISGGGSAMIEWPLGQQISLRDLRAANQILISCGASITEINAVRRAFSAVKGGGLAARAPQVDQITLIVSDTNPGDEASVASGPTIDSPVVAPDAKSVVARYNLWSRLPQSIVQSVQGFKVTSPLPATGALRKQFVLLDNGAAIVAAAARARQLGFKVEIASDLVEQPVYEGCALLLSRYRALGERTREPQQAPCLISGGEFACPVKGSGVGGRNLETVLRLAMEIDKYHGRHMVGLSAGTDGIDGNSPAAGATADETTVERARAIGLDAENFLERSDAFTFFNTLGDAIVTGPTGTNVRDLRILLSSP